MTWGIGDHYFYLPCNCYVMVLGFYFTLNPQNNKNYVELFLDPIRQRQADRNKAQVLRRVKERKRAEQFGFFGASFSSSTSLIQDDTKSQEEWMQELRKCVEKAPIPQIRKSTLDGIGSVSS